MYKINEVFDHSVIRSEANFDRASDAAYKFALFKFEIDEDGHSSKVEGWERSSCSIEIEFKKYIRNGHEHVYNFTIAVRKSENE